MIIGGAVVMFAMPMLIALVVAAVVLAFTGFAAIWVLWLALAWFVFDLYEPTGICAWRFHTDPAATRRPLNPID